MKNLIVISAPSGAGKSTLCEEIRRINPNIKFSISCTTRPKRDYEIEGVNYYFLTNNEFMDKVNNNELVEYEQVHGYYYGTLSNTLKKAIDSEELILFDVDVKGAMSIKKKYPKMFELEAEGLSLLRSTEFTIPNVIAIGEYLDYSYLILAFIETLPANKTQ